MVYAVTAWGYHQALIFLNETPQAHVSLLGKSEIGPNPEVNIYKGVVTTETNQNKWKINQNQSVSNV